MRRLRQLREDRNLTLEQVAKALGLRNQYVSNYELGKRNPDYETLKKFSAYYKVSTDYLLENTDDPTPPPPPKKNTPPDKPFHEELEEALVQMEYQKEGQPLSEKKYKHLMNIVSERILGKKFVNQTDLVNAIVSELKQSLAN